MLRTLFAIAGLFELGRATGKNIPKVLKKSSLTVGTISTMDISVDLIEVRAAQEGLPEGARQVTAS